MEELLQGYSGVMLVVGREVAQTGDSFPVLFPGCAQHLKDLCDLVEGRGAVEEGSAAD